MTPHRAGPSLLIAVLVVVALSSVALTLLGLRREHPAEQVRAADPARPAAPVTAPRPEVEAVAVLGSWDADRADAWAAGDVRRLRGLYAPGSVAGRRDAAMLRRWVIRGLVVDDLRTQVLALRVVTSTPDRWVLGVTDRVVGGFASGRGLRARLPRDLPTTRTVTLRKIGAEWLVAAVER